MTASAQEEKYYQMNNLNYSEISHLMRQEIQKREIKLDHLRLDKNTQTS